MRRRPSPTPLRLCEISRRRPVNQLLRLPTTNLYFITTFLLFIIIHFAWIPRVELNYISQANYANLYLFTLDISCRIAATPTANIGVSLAVGTSAVRGSAKRAGQKVECREETDSFMDYRDTRLCRVYRISAPRNTRERSPTT